MDLRSYPAKDNLIRNVIIKIHQRGDKNVPYAFSIKITILNCVQEALDCYNKALLAASADPRDEQGEDMALAFANR